MQVLVTGGAGFIGSHLCQSLVGEGHTVIALDNFDNFYDPDIKRANLRQCQQDNRFGLVLGDIRDREQVRSIFQTHSIDMVIHLAAKAGVRASLGDPAGFGDVNINGTITLLEAVRKFGIGKFIFASSSSVYGNNSKVPFAESDRVDFPVSPYAATKKAGELICHTYHHLYGIDITCLRLFTVYGPRQRPDLAIHKFARALERGEAIPMYGDGSMRRDYTYIDDIIQGIQSAMERCRGYEIYNLGNSRPVRLDDLISRLEQALGKKADLQRLPLQPGDVNQTYAEITKAREKLDYQPRTELDAGLAEFVKWLRSDNRQIR